MPPRKSRSSGPVGSGRSVSAQQTLAFGRESANRITKPTALPHSESQKKAERLVYNDEKSANALVEISEKVEKRDHSIVDESELATRSSSGVEAAEVAREAQPKPLLGTDEIAAKKISETQIKKYWKCKEDARRAPRVHQQGLGIYEKILREFDLSSQYGVGAELVVRRANPQPCIGISRMKRWKRAQALNLGPPLEVLAVLLKDAEATKPSDIAYIDTLMGGRLTAVEG